MHGFLHAADLAEPERSFPHWEPLKLWLEQHGREASELTLVIHRRDHLLSQADRFALVLQASLAGARLALLLDHAQHLPFDLIERLPLQSLLLGQHLLPELEAMAADSLLARFIQRSRELGIALYLDDPSTCRMPPSGRIAAWQGAGKWLAIFAGRSMSRACGRECRVGRLPASRAALPMTMVVGADLPLAGAGGLRPEANKRGL